MHGYKVFKPDFTCNGYQFALGKTFVHDGQLKLCESGFHFCERLTDCFSYYTFDPLNIVCEVECANVSEETHNDSKRVCGTITIVKQLTWQEVLDLVNIGVGNSGHSNSGQRNSGDYNSGNRNSGNHNSGNSNSGYCNSGYCNSGYNNSGNYNAGHYNSSNRNSGNFNSGNCNSGHHNVGNCNSGNNNSGDCNSGDCNSGNNNSGNCNAGHDNTGNFNSGDYNSGHYNAGNCNVGMFNTDEPNMRLFNKDLPMTVTEFYNQYNVAVYPVIMEYIDGKMIVHDYKTAWQTAWNKANDEERKTILSLPNFDSNIFYEITGINVNT